MTEREALHRLIEQLPDNEIYVARRFLEFLTFREDPLIPFKTALSEQAKAEQAKPEPVPTYVAKARDPATPIQMLARLADDSSDVVREAVASNPQTPKDILEKLAMDSDIKVRLGVARNMQRSAEAYRQVIESNPVDIQFQDPYFSLATDLEEAKRYEEAIAAYGRHLEGKPLDAQAWYRLGIVYYLQKMNKEAVAAYQKATRILPNMADAHLRLASLYGEMDNWAEAMREYQEAVKFAPTDKVAKQGLHHAQIKLRKIKDGRA